MDPPPARCLTTHLTQTKSPLAALLCWELATSLVSPRAAPHKSLPWKPHRSWNFPPRGQTLAGPHVRAGCPEQCQCTRTNLVPNAQTRALQHRASTRSRRGQESTVWRGKGNQNRIRVQRSGLPLFFFLLLFPLFPRPDEHSERTDELLMLALSKSDSSRSSSSLCRGENQEKKPNSVHTANQGSALQLQEQAQALCNSQKGQCTDQECTQMDLP